MLFPNEAIEQAYHFNLDVEKFGYDTSFKELEFSKGKRNYSRILKRLAEVNLPNPQDFIYQRISIEELKELLTTLLNKILGKDFASEIKHLNTIIYLEDTKDIFDSILEEDLQGNIFTPKKIHINRAISTIGVASTGHEYIHAILSKHKGPNFNRVLSNIHYNELLSIITEYILVYELSSLFKEEAITEKHSIIRASHDQAQALEHASSENLRFSFNKLNLDSLTAQYLKIYLDFEAHNSFSYILSDIYSRHFLNLYKEDEKTLLTIIRHILNGEKSIKDLLTYYNLSLSTKEAIDTFYKNLERIQK